MQGEDRKLTYLSTLRKHTQAVNVVRWCPRGMQHSQAKSYITSDVFSGELLASAGDDGNVLLWTPSESPALQSSFGEEGLEDVEHWRVKTMCRSNTGSEIYDLAWSPDGMFFVTGSMDNIARIYNSSNGMCGETERKISQKLTIARPNSSTNCGAQPLRPGCCLGSIKRIRCYPILRSFSTYLHTQDERWPISTQPTQQNHQNGPSWKEDLI